MSKENPLTWVCRDCGSENVSVGAYAYWDKYKQRWYFELSESDDWDLCADCFGETIVMKPLTDLKTAALVAINQNTTSSEDQHDNSAIC
jgi:hypothetical protein